LRDGCRYNGARRFKLNRVLAHSSGRKVRAAKYLLTPKKQYKLRVLENGWLRKIFGLRRKRGIEKIYNEELRNLYSPRYIIIMIKSRKMRWVDHVAFISKVKGEVVPLRSIEAHLGDRRYSSYSFLTSALEGGEWSAFIGEMKNTNSTSASNYASKDQCW
jgi:hypothetical protein